MKNLGILTQVLALIFFLSACKKDDDPKPVQQGQHQQVQQVPPGGQGGQQGGQQGQQSAIVSSYSSKAAVEWMNECYKIVRNKNLSPPIASRVYAYSSITLYESLVNGMPGFKSLGGQLNEFQALPAADTSQVYDWPTVMNRAMKYSLENLLDTTNLNAVYNKQLNERKTAGVKEDVIMRSEDYGVQIAQAVIAYAQTDKFNETRQMVYAGPVRDAEHPQYWEPTSPSATSPLEPYWGTLRPFCMASPEACYMAQTVPFDTTKGSPFYMMADSVRVKVNTLTDEEKDIAKYWADGANTSTPAGHWVSITGQLVESRQLNLEQAANVYVLVGLASGDAFISCWQCKYKDNLLRPVTYINNYIDPNWKPFLPTPPFPEYTSGHSVVSGACASVLTNYFGDNVAFSDTTHRAGKAPRTFPSFKVAAGEAAMSRFYGGIHYGSSIRTGINQGNEVAQCIFKKIHLH